MNTLNFLTLIPSHMKPRLALPIVHFPMIQQSAIKILRYSTHHQQLAFVFKLIHGMAKAVVLVVSRSSNQASFLVHLLLFQSHLPPIYIDIAVHPQAGGSGNTSSNSCASSTPSSSTTTTIGNWQSQFVYGIYQDFLTASIPASELQTSNTSVTYAP